MNSKYVIIKPTSACNFNCTFCSAKNLNIPIHDSVPEVLKEFLLSYQPSSLIITGGEPLVNSQNYFNQLLDIMKQITSDYTISLTSNMVLWDQNPEKYDYLFNNPQVGVITSFQYGVGRKDTTDYSEERFVNLFNKFYQRYNRKLMFIYVVNQDNEEYIFKACELAKRLGTKLKLNQQLPLGQSTIFYPRYKLLDWYLKVIKKGYQDQLESLNYIHTGRCPFPLSYKYCLEGRVVYVDTQEQLQVNNCEDIISASDTITLNNQALFHSCYSCKMFNLCNGCSVNKKYSEPIKEEQCKWMKENKQELERYGFII